VKQVLATQSLIMRKPRMLRAELSGTLPKGIYAKDMILALICRYSVGSGAGRL
jgi:3-isopropylmalate/(R)-2-methylmalate dehydratase large subunit